MPSGYRWMLPAASSEIAVDLAKGFPPILGAEARVLVLGTLPSQQSLIKNQYYGHPRNAFWPIMGELFGAGPNVPYVERTSLLSDGGIAVWDVLKSATRAGSMDSAIDEGSATPNDFAGLCSDHPELQLLCFNGQAAERLFRKRVPSEVQESFDGVRFVTMPSTSPAYAAMGFEEKLARWSEITVG